MQPEDDSTSNESISEPPLDWRPPPPVPRRAMGPRVRLALMGLAVVMIVGGGYWLYEAPRALPGLWRAKEYTENEAKMSAHASGRMTIAVPNYSSDGTPGVMYQEVQVTPYEQVKKSQNQAQLRAAMAAGRVNGAYLRITLGAIGMVVGLVMLFRLV